METQILEGTLAEVQTQLHALSLPPEARLRITLEEVEPGSETKRIRNGITLVPVRDPNHVLTTEMVKELLEAE